MGGARKSRAEAREIKPNQTDSNPIKAKKKDLGKLHIVET
jgi:hypothetical protein